MAKKTLAQLVARKNGIRKSYSIAEDRIIVVGLWRHESATLIRRALRTEGFERTIYSIRHRINFLRTHNDEFSTLEELHEAYN